jgi:glycosyltransferase involved in cell wall biosynthesis
MDISIVIPLYNEVESLRELVAWVQQVCKTQRYGYEIILVDDGSTDGSWEVIEELGTLDGAVKGLRFRRNFGKSAALHEGFKIATGQVVVTMDADLQDNPEEIPPLYDMIRKEDYDLVSGWKKKRYDPISKTIPSKLYNYTARKVTGIRLHDFNCGLKAYKNEVAQSIEVYGEMHRYIPVLVRQVGYTRIGEKVVQHQRRKYGVTKYGMERFFHGFLDLVSITFISKFGKKPMHLFGILGTVMFFLGFAAAFFLGARKLYFLYHHIRAPLVTDSPYFYIALTAMILGTQLFLAGFLGELISRASHDRNHYQVEKTINI